MTTAISLVTLLTDFGECDYFVPSMKGVMLGINPQLRIIDLSHQVPRHSVDSAAYLLKSCYPYFPDGTVHVIVVDPGVGSSRRALLASTSRYHFLAPDNGVLSYIFREELSVEVRAIENKQYRLDSEGSTFEGRDLFSPAAAWLTKGQQPGSYGRLVRDYATLSIDEPRLEGVRLKGRIVYTDQFGNLISNVKRSELANLRAVTKQDAVSVHIRGVNIAGLAKSYQDAPSNLPQALINSNGFVEIFVKEGSAAESLKANVGETLELC